MEINTSGKQKALPEMNPGPEMLTMMAERDIPIVIGSDSHNPGRVSDGFREALDFLEQAGYDTVSVFRERKRSDYPIEVIQKSLADPPPED
jgi:histidinol-phosphatase (PHP family)